MLPVIVAYRIEPSSVVERRNVKVPRAHERLLIRKDCAEPIDSVNDIYTDWSTRYQLIDWPAVNNQSAESGTSGFQGRGLDRTRWCLLGSI